LFTRYPPNIIDRREWENAYGTKNCQTSESSSLRPRFKQPGSRMRFSDFKIKKRKDLYPAMSGGLRLLVGISAAFTFLLSKRGFCAGMKIKG
jgi:hypothetical protein